MEIKDFIIYGSCIGAFLILFELSSGVRSFFKLKATGLKTKATVLERLKPATGSGSNASVVYEYQSGGTTYKDCCDISRKFYNSIAVGDTVEVIYLQYKPMVNTIASELSPTIKQQLFLLFFYAIALFILAIPTLSYFLIPPGF